MKSSNIGGQAVMEGIMMRHKDKYSIAVRRPDKEIELKVEDYKCIFGNAKFLKYPLIRGVVSFVDSLVVGTKCLMYSAEIAGDEEDEEYDEDWVDDHRVWIDCYGKYYNEMGYVSEVKIDDNNNILLTAEGENGTYPNNYVSQSVGTFLDVLERLETILK